MSVSHVIYYCFYLPNLTTLWVELLGNKIGYSFCSPPTSPPASLPSWDIDGIAGISATILVHEVRMAEEDRMLGSLMISYLLTWCVRINHWFALATKSSSVNCIQLLFLIDVARVKSALLFLMLSLFPFLPLPLINHFFYLLYFLRTPKKNGCCYWLPLKWQPIAWVRQHLLPILQIAFRYFE